MRSIYQRLQKYINSFVDSRLGEARKLFDLKSEYWDKKTLYFHIEEEIYNSSLELIELHDKYPILHIITNFPDFRNVLWESTFIESLSLDERKKYLNIKVNTLDFDKLKNDINTYDHLIPYFSNIISTIYLIRYIYFLQSKLPQERNSENLSTKKTTFETELNPAQIELLTRCINEVQMFSEVISEKTLNDIFTCTLSKPLKTRNNRLLVYFFSALDNRSLITRNWQIVIDKNRLFLSSRKRTPLTQTDLSSANLEIKESSPKGSEIIDKYLKELKNH